MPNLQQYRCPVCGAGGAHPAEMPAPFCHVCKGRVKMVRSHNGVVLDEDLIQLCERYGVFVPDAIKDWRWCLTQPQYADIAASYRAQAERFLPELMQKK